MAVNDRFARTPARGTSPRFTPPGFPMRQILAASLLSSGITAAVVTLIGAGPLNPPSGPITPTGVSLDQLAGVVSAVNPGANVPGRTLAGGAGTASLAFSDHNCEVPLVGFGITRPSSGVAIISLAFEAGLYGGHLDSASGPITVTIHGSDGTTLGPVNCSRNQRNLVNGPVVAGNKAVDVLYLNTAGNVPMNDGGGTGLFQ